jgi:inner membrane protein
MALDGVVSSSVTRSPGLKFFLVFVLTVAMAVPLFLIQVALSDRENTAQQAAQDIASGWGGPQVVAGPMLFVPYSILVESQVAGAQPQRQIRTAVLLPRTLDVKANAVTGERWRGIFKVPVYRADIAMHATFDRAAIAGPVPAGAVPLWRNAFIALSVSDAHGVADTVTLQVNGKPISFQPGTGSAGWSGIQAPIDLTAVGSDLDVYTAFVLRGSREFSIVPLGERTTAEISSPWRSPSFFGTFLPTDHAIAANGFKADWTVPYLARGFGQSFASSEDAMRAISTTAFGVRFYQPVDHYQLVQRSLKYAILFVALSFLIFFVAEIVSVRRLHVIQYALVGAAQVLFYLLLLSFAEHTGFAMAYLVGAAATVILTGLYSLSVLASATRSLVLTVVLGALYGLLYVILNAEDYALLIGSTVLFAALATTMYLTRHIDWYKAAPTPA